MVELDNMKYTLSTYQKPLQEVEGSLDLENKEKRIAELDRMMEEPNFWENPEQSTKIVRENKSLKDTVERFHKLSSAYRDIADMIELGNEEGDEELIPEIREMLDGFIHDLEALKAETLLTGEYDANNAILRLNAGAGGTEAQDWTQMLLRMYGRWAERHGFTVDTADLQPGDEAGVKSATLFIKGHNAYGFLKSEKGVHRLVRISPFDSQARRHTSFSACDVMPEIDDAVEVPINMDDVRVDYFRASGAGGQHINKTSSAVRMTHEPTGIVVQCQNERSQLQNKEQCLKMLRAKLFELEQEKKEEEIAKLEGVQQKIEWGSQIRSYVFQPYTMVKDVRTNAETGNVQAVMDGDIDPFIRAYLNAKANHEF